MAEKKPTIKKEEETARAVGRRKSASARVRILLGKGSVTVNGRSLKDYFPVLIMQQKVLSPLKTVGKEKSFDVSAKVTVNSAPSNGLLSSESVTINVMVAPVPKNPHTNQPITARITIRISAIIGKEGMFFDSIASTSG